MIRDQYATLRALRSGQTVALEGCVFKAADSVPLSPGDWYVAERNTGPHLLTVLEVADRPGQGYVLNREGRYPFDISECVRVVEVDVPIEQANFLPKVA